MKLPEKSKFIVAQDLEQMNSLESGKKNILLLKKNKNIFTFNSKMIWSSLVTSFQLIIKRYTLGHHHNVKVK